MTFKEYLIKAGVTDEVATSVVSGMPENKFFITNEEKIEDRYKKIKEQKENVEADLKTANDLVEKLKISNKDSEELQAQITTYQGQLKDLTAQREQDQKNNAINLVLKDAKARNLKATRALLDLNKITLKGDALEGLSEQLKTLQEKEPYFFEKATDPTGHQRVVFDGNPSGHTTEDLTLTEKIAQRMRNDKP